MVSSSRDLKSDVRDSIAADADVDWNDTCIPCEMFFLFKLFKKVVERICYLRREVLYPKCSVNLLVNCGHEAHHHTHPHTHIHTHTHTTRHTASSHDVFYCIGDERVKLRSVGMSVRSDMSQCKTAMTNKAVFTRGRLRGLTLPVTSEAG